MNEEECINVLVLPELFPKFDGDVTGVFIVDYLASVHSLVKTNTLYIRLSGDKKGINEELFQGKFSLKRVVLTTKKVSSILKPFFYILWFLKGYKLGKQYTNTDVIHAHGAVLNGTLAYLLSKKLKIPYVVTEHIGPYSRILNNRVKNKISKFILSRATKVLAVSQHQKNEISKLKISPENITVSFNPVATSIYKLNTINTSKNIVFVSRLDEFKGGLRTLKAFHKITDNYPEFKLIIAGEGEETKVIEKYIETHHLTERVTFMGTLTKPEMADLFSRCYFMVFPSRHETFGLVVAEALSCGLPVVCTNQTAPKEFINDKNGILVEPDNIDAIANGMEQMIINRERYNSELIHNQIKERFGLENFGDYLTGVYKKARNVWNSRNI